jgi:nickel transport system permease protein
MFLTMLGFALLHLGPSDPAAIIAAQRYGSNPSAESIATVRVGLGLDRPLTVQYVNWVRRIVRGDFGTSFGTGDSVASEFSARLPATLQLTFAAMIVTATTSLIWSKQAIRIHSPADRALRVFSTVATSVPDFVVALVSAVIFSVSLRWLPVFGNSGWRAFVLPTLSLALARIAMLARYSTSQLTHAQYQPFVVTAAAKGLQPAALFRRHILMPTAPTILNMVGYQTAALLTGTVIVERVFAWPGIGDFYVQAVLDRDLPVIQAGLLFFGTTCLLITAAVDIVAALLSPHHRRPDR